MFTNRQYFQIGILLSLTFCRCISFVQCFKEKNLFNFKYSLKNQFSYNNRAILFFFWNILRPSKIAPTEINPKIPLNHRETTAPGYCAFYLRGKKYKPRTKPTPWCLNRTWIGFVTEVKCDQIVVLCRLIPESGLYSW